MNNSRKRILSLGKLGRRFGRSRYWVSDYVNRGFIPTILIGKRKFVTMETVERIEREGFTRPSAPTQPSETDAEPQPTEAR